VNGSLQTLERPTHSPATNALSEALERFDRTSVRLGLDSATTGLRRAAIASIRGFGKVAQHAAKRFVNSGGTVIAVPSWDGEEGQAYTFRKPSGVHPQTDGTDGPVRNARLRPGSRAAPRFCLERRGSNRTSTC
jgi:hypothetical protein